MHAKPWVIALVALVIGFGSGFVLRPVLVPGADTPPAATAPFAVSSSEPRGTQYFEVNLDEARQIIAQCRDGMVRGTECANADIAVAQADGKANFDAFMGR
ncbi:hypothetical protein KNJ79_19795 [Sphingopyxis indica]|uniref:hypothetical protein n=1 Tax=Sphingomonadales TaxID=204457 RepID=UPI00293912D6|nr:MULTISPECIES: hypothetical protein [Sphingomonadales]MEA3390393.1 hypothetical protein [Pseudomonadota bacterium]WOF43314.1 hypothetical protein KNJ79_19795 [Sphingopyxis indica]WRO66104.1 hypothetical protein U8326_13810 [Tsuneonella sp. CC-YZS046]